MKRRSVDVILCPQCKAKAALCANGKIVRPDYDGRVRFLQGEKLLNIMCPGCHFTWDAALLRTETVDDGEIPT